VSLEEDTFCASKNSVTGGGLGGSLIDIECDFFVLISCQVG